jgi:hypothetical protein
VRRRTLGEFGEAALLVLQIPASAKEVLGEDVATASWRSLAT